MTCDPHSFHSSRPNSSNSNLIICKALQSIHWKLVHRCLHQHTLFHHASAILNPVYSWSVGCSWALWTLSISKSSFGNFSSASRETGNIRQPLYYYMLLYATIYYYITTLLLYTTTLLLYYCITTTLLLHYYYITPISLLLYYYITTLLLYTTTLLLYYYFITTTLLLHYYYITTTLLLYYY